jgi:hypothetical protein
VWLNEEHIRSTSIVWLTILPVEALQTIFRAANSSRLPVERFAQAAPRLDIRIGISSPRRRAGQPPVAALSLAMTGPTRSDSSSTWDNFSPPNSGWCSRRRGEQADRPVDAPGEPNAPGQPA